MRPNWGPPESFNFHKFDDTISVQLLQYIISSPVHVRLLILADDRASSLHITTAIGHSLHPTSKPSLSHLFPMPSRNPLLCFSRQPQNDPWRMSLTYYGSAR
ncbi:hypothetical protein YC2023_017318 [Brassica napus]